MSAVLKKQVLPTAEGKLLSGSLWDFRRDPLKFITETIDKYGGFVRLRFAWQNVYLISDPEVLQKILVTDYDHYIKDARLRSLHPLMGNGLVLSEGDFWKRQRRLSQPAFHKRRFDTYGDEMVKLTEKTLDIWQSGEVKDMGQEMITLTLAIVCKTLFDADVGSTEGKRLAQLLPFLLERAYERGNGLLPIPESIPTPGNVHAKKNIAELDAIVYRIIEEKRGHGKDSGDLLSMLMSVQDEDGSQMTDQQLRDEVMTFFIAGHETTASTLTWLFWMMSENPSTYESLKEEVSAVLGQRRVTMEDLPKLKYTDALVRETLRLYPVLWAMGRQNLHDVNLGGYDIPAGSMILMSAYANQRSAKFYDQPNEFQPERWLNPEIKKLNKFAFFPFGGGPRLCIGMPFSFMESAMILVTMIQRFDFKALPGQQIEPVAALTVKPSVALNMELMSSTIKEHSSKDLPPEGM